MTSTSNQKHQIGDTFKDMRNGRHTTVTIKSFESDGPLFQLLSSDQGPFDLRCYVTEQRLLQITGGSDPISHAPEDVPDDFTYLDPKELIPAESVTAHVHPRSDGTIVVRYYAWSDVWNVDWEPRFKALNNEVKGCYLFDGEARIVTTAASKMIATSLYPYRMSPETVVSARLFPEKRSLLDRIRLKVFGGTATIPNDEFTDAIEAELTKLAEAAPPSSAFVQKLFD